MKTDEVNHNRIFGSRSQLLDPSALRHNQSLEPVTLLRNSPQSAGFYFSRLNVVCYNPTPQPVAKTLLKIIPTVKDHNPRLIPRLPRIHIRCPAHLMYSAHQLRAHLRQPLRCLPGLAALHPRSLQSAYHDAGALVRHHYRARSERGRLLLAASGAEFLEETHGGEDVRVCRRVTGGRAEV